LYDLKVVYLNLSSEGMNKGIYVLDKYYTKANFQILEMSLTTFVKWLVRSQCNAMYL
jgi:hypothetical protein